LLALYCSYNISLLVQCMQAGLKFLAENAKKEGVNVLPSGLQFKVIASGPSSGRHPSVSTPCECHYSGTTITGQEFDSSFKRGQPAGMFCCPVDISHCSELPYMPCSAIWHIACWQLISSFCALPAVKSSACVRSLLCHVISSLRVCVFALLCCMLHY
jgi:Domain amino terminal to FKBP-type peptidyl-prolyl isomerase